MEQLSTPHESAHTPSFFARLRARVAHGPLWHNRNFMRLWIGQSISQAGSTITREALPYTAILVLGATPTQMGFLGAAGSAPILLIGLLAGVWVDRLRRRPLMIAADIGRALLLLSIPIAYMFGLLRIEQLYVVAALVGILSVFFEAAYQSFLPILVERDQLVEGNSKLGMSDSVAEIAGPPLGGLLVQLLNGPLVILLDACSFIWSALWLRRIPVEEPRPHGDEHAGQVWAELREGVAALWQHPILRWLAIVSVVSNFFGWFFGAIYSLYGIRELGLSPALVGVTVAFGGIGAFAGAFLVTPISRRWGVGPTIVGAKAISTFGSILIWLAGGSPILAFFMLATAQIVSDAAAAVGEINQTSLRQTVTPHHLLGRVNAGMNVLGQGIGTLGVLTGGILGEVIGLRPTVAIAAGGLLLSGILMLVSPVRRVRQLEVDRDETTS